MRSGKKEDWVPLCCPGYQPLPIHERNPTTAPHGDFCLLRFRPGPVRPSLDNLVVLASAGPTISMPSLVRTPDRHRLTTNSTPKLKRSTNPGLLVAGLQTHATAPSRQKRLKNQYMKHRQYFAIPDSRRPLSCLYYYSH